MRATRAVPPKPMVKTGRTKALALRAPDTGNQPSQTEKISIRINPSQKLGMVEPSRTPPIMALSGHLSLFNAATTPKETPTTDENNSASPPKRSECGKACRIRSDTGRRATIAVPKSPCITWPNQMPYCTGKG